MKFPANKHITRFNNIEIKFFNRLNCVCYTKTIEQLSFATLLSIINTYMIKKSYFHNFRRFL